ncbi:winged helix-turn-helix domain-containing protein [Halomicrobium katesii]|uniref:winged helix-turn-helix domain-containing protein n=1 Tax=Halomicrobium katesii TaxID=437163 RepID=UPI00035EAFDB|nr:helix-turn-helix domain-containing protein [Halomicrobium katesii]
MTDEVPSEQALFDALADPDCRAIVAALDEPTTAKGVADQCDLSRTSAYRKLETLSDAALVAERTKVRDDGHHTTQFVRDFRGVFVAFDGDESFDVDVVDHEETPDERLARFWSQISEEL